MAVRSTPASVLPYMAWSTATAALVPPEWWETVFASMQTLKAHVQEYPGCQRFEAWVHPEDDGTVRVHCYTTWDTPEQRDAFVERGYTFERMLADAVGLEPEATRLMEKVF
jgi:hypothetical protein